MGDLEDGMNGFRSVLETSRAIDLRIVIAIALEYVAEAAVWGGELRRAVRLGAAAARLKEELGGGVPPRIGGGLDPLAVGREQLSKEAFDREERAGLAMDLDRAIAEARTTGVPESVPQQLDRGSR